MESKFCCSIFDSIHDFCFFYFRMESYKECKKADKCVLIISDNFEKEIDLRNGKFNVVFNYDVPETPAIFFYTVRYCLLKARDGHFLSSWEVTVLCISMLGVKDLGGKLTMEPKLPQTKRQNQYFLGILDIK